MAQAALGSITAIGANTAEELATVLIREEGGSFLVNGRQPPAWLRRMLAATNKPLIISLDDPRVAIGELASHNGVDLASATRLVGCSCVSMMSCIALPSALVVHADRDWHQPLETAVAIAHHLGLSVGSGDIERAVADLAAIGRRGETDLPGSDASQPNEATLPVTSGAVAPYRAHFMGAPLEPITWAREVFLADGHQPATHAVDITGRTRALIYGPYISLPPGNWVAEVVLGFSREAAEVNFLVDVLTAGSQLSVTSIRPMQAGIFSVNLSFMIGDDNDHPVEFRVINEHAAFDGRVMLGHVTLTLQNNPSSEAVDLLTTELGLSR